MKKKSKLKKVLLIIGIIIAGLIVAGVCINLILFKTISEDKTTAFLDDSQDAVYELIAEGNADPSDSELMAKIGAACYVAQNNDQLQKEDGAYVISPEELSIEVTSLFYDGSTVDFSDIFEVDDSGNYLLSLPESSDDQSYQITDSFYGYVGSEPTTLQVTYTCGQQELEVSYSLAYDKNSSYSFQITEVAITGSDL